LTDLKDNGKVGGKRGKRKMNTRTVTDTGAIQAGGWISVMGGNGRRLWCGRRSEYKGGEKERVEGGMG